MKIHYVVAFYPCPREISTPNPLLFTQYHLNFIQTANFYKSTFVYNFCDQTVENKIKELTHNKVNTIFRPNTNCSYGAWEHAVIQNINEPIDYHFLSEDDYIPTNPHFLIPYLQQITPNTAYVCGFIRNEAPETPPQYNQKHAAIANGILSQSAAQQIYKIHNKLFDLNPIGEGFCWKNQITFLNLFKEYEMKHIAHICTLPQEHLNIIRFIGHGPIPHAPLNLWIKHHKLI